MSDFGQSDRQRSSIVALGSFNPAIFHPAWFARHELIRDSEAESSELKVVSPEITVIDAEWFALQVTAERFSVETRDPRKFPPLKDLVVGTFGILEHTPMRAFGFNSYQCFSLPSTEAWHSFGHHFAPKMSWTGLLNEPGLQLLTIQGRRSGSSADRIQISIQPAAHNGVVISINEHYDIKPSNDPDEPQTPQPLLAALEQGWGRFLDYANTVGQHLMKEGRSSECC